MAHVERDRTTPILTCQCGHRVPSHTGGTGKCTAEGCRCPQLTRPAYREQS
jgi:hypothetical protein